MRISRRQFLKTSVAASGLVMSGSSLLGQEKGVGRLAKRVLGKTGERVSMIALGGIVVMNETLEHAREVVGEAIERGVNYFDVAPTYGDAETRLGPALAPFRDEVFLACKTTRRDRAGASEELAKSLERLGTDHVDLYQLHGIGDVEKDVKQALSKEGAIQAFLEARKDGRVRHIGFSAHTPAAALAAMRGFDFDTVMYPVNFATHFASGFDTEVLAEAKKRGMGIIGIKAIAKQKWAEGEARKYGKCWYEPIDEPELARLALSWAYSQGITVAIPPGEETLWRLAAELAPSCEAPTGEETERLRKLAGTLRPIFDS